MPWTKITRAQYLRNGLRYVSDMTDAEWRLIARKLPRRCRLGRPRKVDLRDVEEGRFALFEDGLRVVFSSCIRGFDSLRPLHAFPKFEAVYVTSMVSKRLLHAADGHVSLHACPRCRRPASIGRGMMTGPPQLLT